MHFERFSLFTLSTFSACQQVPTCEEAKKSFLGGETNVVIQSKNDFGRELKIKGYNPITKKAIDYKSGTSGLFIYIRDATTIGDTLVKSNNSTQYLLRKKDCNLIFGFKCKGDIYLESVVDTLKKSIVSDFFLTLPK